MKNFTSTFYKNFVLYWWQRHQTPIKLDDDATNQANAPDIMKTFRPFLICFVVAGACVVSGCATNSAPASQTLPASGMKGIEQKPAADNAGWADSIGWFFLETLYATAVANQSN